MEVELSKQLRPPLTDQQRLQLAMDLQKFGMSAEELRRRGDSVKLKDTYGTIALSYWIDDLVMTKDEVMREVGRVIAQRKADLEKMHVPEDQIIQEGLVDLRYAYARKYEAFLDHIRGKLEARVKKARAFVLTAPEDVRQEVKTLAEEKGLLRDDPYWRQTIQYVVPDILSEVELIMRRVG
jgi:hypothetical protein